MSDQVVMYHEALEGAEITVTPKQAEIWKKSGWREVPRETLEARAREAEEERLALLEEEIEEEDSQDLEEEVYSDLLEPDEDQED